MRLGLDARILAYPKCGISTYVYNLVKNLVDLDSGTEIFLFSDRQLDSYAEGLFNSPRVKKIIFATNKKERRRWAQKFLPRELEKYKIDIYHATWNNCVPFRRRCPCVLTIHDLAPWVLPRTFRHIRKEAKYKLKHLFCAHLADLIITDSFKVKEDVSRLCRVSKNKIQPIYLGIEEEFLKEPDKLEIKNNLSGFNLEEKGYLIDSCGVNHYRRNAIFALEGFYLFLKKTKSSLRLVYTGEIDRQNKETKLLFKRIKELGLEKDVVFTGWLSNNQLKVLIRGALISIIPSLYEGFGLPILEAFACEVPVIATNRGSIPEIVKDAAVIIDSFNPQLLAQRIEELIDNPLLGQALIAKGKERLKDFAWQKTASLTLEIYKRLIEISKTRNYGNFS